MNTSPPLPAKAYKPSGYTSAAPYLIVNGARDTIDFLRSVVGAEPLRIHQRPDGKIAHGEVRLDDTVVMLADAMAGWPAVASHVHLYVPDVEATFAAALAAGTTSVQPPVESGDGDRRGGFRDAGGTTWWVSTQV